jgi:hypothetical protein
MKEWSKLRPLSKLDQLAECIMKASFIMSHEYKVVVSYVDHKGCNFRVENKKGETYDVLCKQINTEKTNYTFVTKQLLEQGLRSDLFIGLVIFIDGKKPTKYLFPSTVWQNPNKLFTDSGLKHSEYGISVTGNNFADLAKYAWECKKM